MFIVYELRKEIKSLLNKYLTKNLTGKNFNDK